jgi:hypothetical protein
VSVFFSFSFFAAPGGGGGGGGGAVVEGRGGDFEVGFLCKPTKLD